MTVARSARPARAPRLLWLVAGGSALVAGGLTPELLIRWGPMRRSLQSPHDSVRQVAEWEVTAARVAALGLAFTLVAIAWRWPRLHRWNWVQRIAQRIPRCPSPAWTRRQLLNLPAGVLTALLGAALWFLSAGQSYFPPETYRELSREDGILEQGTAYVFAVAALLAFGVFRTLPRGSERFLSGLLVVGFAVCVGEEFSWGQRLFHFETPEALRDANVQGEANLHNLFGYAADHLFIAGLLLYGSIFPLLTIHYEWLHRLGDRWGVPVASPGLALAMAGVGLLHTWWIVRVFPATPLRIEELREFLSAVGLALILSETRTRWSAAADQRAEFAP